MQTENQAEQIVLALQHALREINKEALLGNNSVVRRIKSILHGTLQPFENALNIESDSNRDPPDIPCRVGEMLPLQYVLDEFHADDRRRSVFIDTDEAILANMVDYISGRLQSVEFRDPQNLMNMPVVREKARDLMRGHYPIIVVNHELSKEPSEIPFLLRSLADKIENDEFKIKARTCINRTESLGTRWVNNGRTLEEGSRIVEKCCTHDSCCRNQTCGERTIAGGWTPIWNDGNTAAPPPVIPPPFEPNPWNNRLAFLDDGFPASLTSDWGWRNLNGTPNFHGGIDLAVPNGTSIKSIDGGRVLFIKNSGHDSGVVIGNEGSIMFTYWHITPNNDLKVGDSINAGDILGTVAPGGADHLHYAHHEPPGGNVAERNDSNSRDPLP